MKLHEAIKHMEEGKKVRLPYWNKDKYVCVNEKNCIVDHEGQITMIYGILSDEWELVEDKPKFERMEAPQVFKDLYKVVNDVMKLPFEDDIILQFIKNNDYEYSLDSLQHLLNAMNNLYNLDNK